MKKVLIGFMAIVVLYYLLVTYIQNPFTPVRTLWQENIVVADGAFSLDTSPEIIIVGSSLSFRLKNELLPYNYYNLALSGMAAVDGLELIKRFELEPKVIIIEVNHLERPPADYFYENYSCLSTNLKKYCFLFREENNPLTNYIIPLVSKMGRLLLTGRWEIYSISKVSKGENIEAYKKRFDQAVCEFSTSPDVSAYNKNISNLERYVDFFQSRGVKIVFFEMPMDPVLTESKLLSVNKQTAEDLSSLVECENADMYQTTDGKHLTQGSILAFIKVLIPLADSLKAGP